MDKGYEWRAMDKGRRDGIDTSFEPWHSTPVKNNVGVPVDVSKVSVRSSTEMDGMARRMTQSVSPFSEIPCHTHLQCNHISVSDVESATIQRQRRELHLLIAELKERDRELNTMAASHHTQLHAWEQDRQRVLALEKRCGRLDDELQKRNAVIRALTKRVQIVETRENEIQKELGATQLHFHKLELKHQDMSHKSQEFQEKNQSLNSSVMDLSSRVGSLQVREEELSSMLKLKDKAMTEATTHIVDLKDRLRDLDSSLKESGSRERRLLRDVEEYKRRYRESRHENTNLKEELQQHITQSSAQREEIIRLKQEHQLLCRELALSGEGDGWKDELLALARSKQDRTDSELHCLRQVCENQQNDLQLLQLNLETAREALRERNLLESFGSHEDSTTSLLRMRDSWSAHDTEQQATAGGDPELLSPASSHGGRPVVTCRLQRVLGGSTHAAASVDRNTLKHTGSVENKDTLVSLSVLRDGSSTGEASHCHTCPKSPCCQTTSKDKICETPPEV